MTDTITALSSLQSSLNDLLEQMVGLPATSAEPEAELPAVPIPREPDARQGSTCRSNARMLDCG